jgi:uncharacterized membrane protein YciS (DUF1049 family)
MLIKTALDGTIFVAVVYAVTLIISLLVAGIIYLIALLTKQRKQKEANP